MAYSNAERSARWRKRHPAKSRALSRDNQRRLQAAKKEAEASTTVTYPTPPANPAQAVYEWAKATLVVPPIHKNEGQKFELPPFLVDFFRDALAPDCRESLLCIARKNSKSGAVAVLLLAHLVGPLMKAGWRCGVASLSRQKAAELRLQIESIAKASGLKDVRFWHRSAPAITAPGGSVDILAADANSGAASGFDLAIIDELGLMAEKHRPLVNSLRSSVSARDGKFMSLSVHGSSPFIPVDKTEIRFFELRAEGERALSGVALSYGDVATLPWGRERFLPGAFGDVSKLDVLMDVAHDRGRALARTGGGGLILTDTPEALTVRAELAATREADDTLALIRGKVLRGLSIGFRAERERVEGDIRIVESAELRSVSIVDAPAYPESTVQARSKPSGAKRRRVWL